ncbi:hypothetical protein OG21DRAFT_1527507 [Imleria badia]|nr:hypothetical protein OG21DRAFT_1527507 [Imleria badia]
MHRLRTAMEPCYVDQGVKREVYTPGNLETLALPVRHARITGMRRLENDFETRWDQCNFVHSVYLAEKGNGSIMSKMTFVQVIGRLAGEVPRKGDVLSDLFVAKGCSYMLPNTQDLEACTGPTMPVVTQKQRLVVGVAWELVMGVVDVKQTGEQQVTLECPSSADNDTIADATLVVLAGIDKNPASVNCKEFASN